MKSSYYKKAEAEIEAINIEAVNGKFALKYEGIEFDNYIYLYELICKDYHIKRNTTRSKLLINKIDYLIHEMIKENNWQLYKSYK